MPSHLHEDHSSAQPPQPGAVEALITQARRLRGEVDAVRRDSATAADDEDPQLRWQRALCDLAMHQLDDLGEHLGQLRDGLSADDQAAIACPDPAAEPPDAPAVQALGRAGSAEWDLLTDAVDWSDELYRIFGRAPQDLSLIHI